MSRSWRPRSSAANCRSTGGSRQDHRSREVRALTQKYALTLEVQDLCTSSKGLYFSEAVSTTHGPAISPAVRYFTASVRQGASQLYFFAPGFGASYLVASVHSARSLLASSLRKKLVFVPPSMICQGRNASAVLSR